MCGGSPSPTYISQWIPLVFHQRRHYIGLLIPTGRKIREINEPDQLNIRTEDLPEEPEETGYALDNIHALIPSRHV